MARVEIEIDGEQYVREVAVSDKLQEDALLGADIPLWVHFLKSLKPEEMAGVKELVLKEECSYAAITRAQARKSSTEETGAGASNTDLPLKDHLEEEQNGDGGMEESNTDSPPRSDDHPTGAVGTEPKDPYSIQHGDGGMEESNTDSPPSSDDHPAGVVGTDPKEPYSTEGSTEVAEEVSNTDSPPTDHFEMEPEELDELFPFDDSLFQLSKPTKPYRTRAQ